MATPALFSFEDLTHKDKAVKAVTAGFKKAGLEPAEVRIDPKIRKTAGASYREISLVFGDSQIVLLRIKDTGDVFQVLVNKTVKPITNQDDQTKAIKEIVALLTRGREAFQKKLARQKTKLPRGMTTAAPKLEEKLVARRDELKGLVEEAQAELEQLRAA